MHAMLFKRSCNACNAFAVGLCSDNVNSWTIALPLNIDSGCSNAVRDCMLIVKLLLACCNLQHGAAT